MTTCRSLLACALALGAVLTTTAVPAQTAQSPAVPAPTALSPADRAALAEAARFRTVRSVAELPPPVLKVAGDFYGRLADPGADWAPTDVINPSDKRAHRRLVWAAAGPAHWVVHYEQGGIARTTRVDVVRVTRDGGAELAFAGYAPLLADYPQFLRALETGELRGDRR